MLIDLVSPTVFTFPWDSNPHHMLEYLSHEFTLKFSPFCTQKERFAFLPSFSFDLYKIFSDTSLLLEFLFCIHTIIVFHYDICITYGHCVTHVFGLVICMIWLLAFFTLPSVICCYICTCTTCLLRHLSPHYSTSHAHAGRNLM